MSNEQKEEKTLLPHHEQQPLCTTRLPYRQGRKLTAVKVYTINNESVHLLIFGVPSLNIRQETKALFSKFGKVLQFNITTKYPNEMFTETYHALFERIQSARIAKKMLDGHNFYGGFLHVCYAPDLETVQELKNKLMQRKRDVSYRLKGNTESDKRSNFQEVKIIEEETASIAVYKDIINEIPVELSNGNTLNMGEENIIYMSGQRKRRKNKMAAQKKIKLTTESIDEHVVVVVDCTNVDKETVTDLNAELIDDCHVENVEINEMLNYSNFGNEVIKKVPEKPLNKIVFHFNNKKII